jgi:hypothetical protein
MNTFLCIGFTCWGRGQTSAEALRNARKAGGANNVRSHLLYLSADPEVYVDELNICQKAGSPPVLLVKRVRDGKELPLENAA